MMATARTATYEQLRQESLGPLNTSGFIPLDKRILVLPDVVEEKIGSLYVPDSVKEQKQWAQTKATLIAVGETAWSEATYDAEKHGLAFTPPQPGDRVLYAKYEGQSFDGADGKKYVIMNDADLVARLSDG